VTRRTSRKPVPVAVAQRHADGHVDFHFPVEIHLEAPHAPVDLDRIAEHVYERLARRLGEDA
jgi:hypothetical protein